MNDCLTLEDEGAVILQNIRNYSPMTPCHPTTPKSSATPLQDPQICTAERLLDIPINCFY
jgi:hypothetical protein